MPQVLVAYTDDEPGVLTRIASLFRRRGFNIHSLTVGPTERKEVARMTLVVDTDEMGVKRVESHLRKLVNVLDVECLQKRPAVVRDLALVRVSATVESRPSVLQMAQIFRANIVDISEDSLVIECTGSLEKIDGLIEVLRPFGILELGRTGAVAMARGGTAAASSPWTAPAFTGTDENLAMSV